MRTLVQKLWLGLRFCFSISVPHCGPGPHRVVMLKTEGWQTFPVKGKTAIISGFGSHPTLLGLLNSARGTSLTKTGPGWDWAPGLEFSDSLLWAILSQEVVCFTDLLILLTQHRVWHRAGTQKMSDIWLSKSIYSVSTVESETLKPVFVEYILCSRKGSKSLMLFSLMLTTSLTGRYHYDARSTGKVGKAHKGQTCSHWSQESQVAGQGRCLSPYALPLVTQLVLEAPLPTLTVYFFGIL